MATLKAFPREGAGKGTARKLRRTGRVPAVVYGHGDRTESLAVDAHDLELLLSHAHVGSTVVSLQREGGGQSDVLIRDVQMHPYKPEVLHVDFLHLHAGEAIRITVSVRLGGVPAGVRDDGGVLDQVLYQLDLEALPGDIPEYAEGDVSELGVGDALRVRDLVFRGGAQVTVLNDPELTVAIVHAPTVHAVEEPEPAEAAAPEPELVRRERGGDEE
jgi:large subunit ribosomal protein L25